MTEKSTIEFLNSKGLNLVKAKNQFSYFDASDDSYLVEIKNRKKYYSDKLIESMKLYSNFQQSVIQGKKLLYVVTDEKGVWIFNISDYIDVIIKTPPKVLNLPKTTEFGNNDKIPKYCYTLPESIAKHFKFS
tara:strand:- start:238 stop:633 length:396 start_codon:yes stop_codon:yes gene_type:complete